MHLVAFFFPLFSPVGEAVYNWIARNRHLMMGGELHHGAGKKGAAEQG